MLPASSPRFSGRDSTLQVDAGAPLVAPEASAISEIARYQRDAEVYRPLGPPTATTSHGDVHIFSRPLID